MLPKEVIKNVRRIQITTSRMVSDVFAGQYHSVFKGSGMEFDEVRAYNPGDEIRSIDWNVTARMGNPFVKKFVEERELTVMLLLDMSQSAAFGSIDYMKGRLAAEISSVLAFSAIKNNDKVGLIIFTDKIEKFIPPRKGMSHVLRVIREAIYFKPVSSGTNISGALEYLSKILKRKSVAFLISDFFDKDYKKSLTIANKRHDVIAITITDPLEVEMPNIGLVELYDAENGKEFLLDTSSSLVRREYKERAAERIRKRRGVFLECGVDNIDIRTNIPYTKGLVGFFKTREKRLRK